MVKKNMRSMKVYEQSGNNYKSPSTIMLKGQWLKNWDLSLNSISALSD